MNFEDKILDLLGRIADSLEKLQTQFETEHLQCQIVNLKKTELGI